ncbi:MAG: signal peptidase I, partial [Thermoguttaceae bacterium]
MIMLFSQTWFIDGLVVPCRVAGGSMAVALLGMHHDVICADCGFAFACDTAVRPASPRAICPNCGYANNNMESLPDLDGDRVLIDRWAFHFRQPRRWEIVAFRYPQEARKIVIKRVVGLPGESIQILNGDVYVNGQIQRKTLDRQRSMAVMVYDANYSPARTPTGPILHPRWQGENEKSLWISDHGRFTHPDVRRLSKSSYTSESLVKRPHPGPLPTAGAVPGKGTISGNLPTAGAAPGDETIDWLVYHHWRRIPLGQGEVQECPITDIMAYNQSLPRREEDVHAMSDLMLSFRLMKTFGQGKFFIRADYGKDVFLLEIDPEAGIYRINRNDREISPVYNRIALENKALDVIVSLIDRQFLLAFNDRTVFCLPMDDPIPRTEPTSQSFAIGTTGLGVVVEDLQIYRDIY